MNTLFTQKAVLGTTGIGFLVIAGLYSVLLPTSEEHTLSKFTQQAVTNQNAASLWQPSSENPYRVGLGTLTTKVDGLVVAILKKGTTLSASGFTNFITSLNTGIKGLAAKPAYASNTEVQNIIGYLTYELTDTEKVLAATNGASYSNIATLVNTPATTVNTPSVSSPSATTSTQTFVARESSNQVTSSGNGTCSGNVPSGMGVTTQGYATATPGPVTIGTVWTFKKDTQQYGCTWDCDTGYERDGNNGCKARAAGSGERITIINPAQSNAPVAGVQVNVLQHLGNAVRTITTLTTDGNGATSEFYIPEDITKHAIIYSFEKEGMKITGANGCQSRVTQGYSFCDSPSLSSITINMGSASEATLTLRDNSLSFGSVVGLISSSIGGAEAGLLACTTPASNASACDNPSSPLANQPGWSYNASSKEYTVYLDISGDGWPHQEYRTCLRNPGQSVQCFNFTPQVVTMSQDFRMQSNGTHLTLISGNIMRGGKNLLACTQLASSGECEPTTVLANQPGWTYDNGNYFVNLNVDGQGWPKAGYISCYKSAGIAKTCFTTNAN